ncbi:hypothetical protein [Endozoicomonas sp. GU-1]|uniref:hypothetical protein n=1 Tax=Endozoicomonas sp. GU-1 TaxID=3009078 RepID=UPI0022B39ADB|nr:hypothetical protein [Endozoicomonas sp. GU-1]WBA82607.1 hypothetical protein O2T12_05555 [Endozoicomonas sp. GU-1]WBA85536.1 hypothetical protein O3276_20210 [Endozoicomonas sp. GU-1]
MNDWQQHTYRRNTATRHPAGCQAYRRREMVMSAEAKAVIAREYQPQGSSTGRDA